MALSQSSRREKTVLVVLAVLIVLALVGIGILIARLASSGGWGQSQEGISVTETALVVAEAAPTVTLIPPPSLEGLGQPAAAPVSSEATVVWSTTAIGPLAPVMVVSYPLAGGHRYRLEITAANGGKVPIQGSWGQAATSASGQVAIPPIQFFQGTTPYGIDLVAPVSNPSLWSVSASAGHRGLPAQPPVLTLTILDVTGAQ